MNKISREQAKEAWDQISKFFRNIGEIKTINHVVNLDQYFSQTCDDVQPIKIGADLSTNGKDKSVVVVMQGDKVLQVIDYCKECSLRKPYTPMPGISLEPKA